MKKCLISIFAVFFVALGFSLPATACGDSDETNCAEALDSAVTAEETAKETPEDSADADTSEKYFFANAEVKSASTVLHSLLLAGNSVSSSDHVKGLALLAGNLVSSSGYSDYSLLAGNSITVSGEVKNDLFVAGNAITLDESANIGRDVFAVGSTILIKSNLYGNVFAAGSRLVLENVTIDGDLTTSAEEIVIKGKSSVAGTFSYNDTAVVTGLDDLATGETKTYAGATTSTASFGNKLLNKFLFLLGRIVVTIVLLALFANFGKKLLEPVSASGTWKRVGLGLGVLLLVPLACIFAVMTFVGLPLGIIALVFYGLFAYFSTSVTGGVVGNLLAEKLLKKPDLHIYTKYALGITLISLASLIPTVGSIFSAVAVCFGVGHLARTAFRKPAKLAKTAKK